jgi:CubicO group peptidase (beta-lactamase class C family)
MISLSAHGQPSDARYSAVWVKESGPGYVATHGLPIDQYQGWFDTQVKQGYSPVLVTATGTGGNAVVAAVFEKNAPPFIAKHGLTSGSDENQGTIEYWCKEARRRGYVLTSGSIYGTSSQRLYIAVWHLEPQAHWSYRTAETATDYQTSFTAFRDAELRPSFVTLSEQQVYLSAFRDDSIGQWVARHGMTSDAYQNEFDTQIAKGMYPICVQGGGTGSGTRYAAIFAKQHEPAPRVWTVKGSGLSSFDATVKQFMLANGVRVGQLTVAKNGVLKAQRAYTWAHAGYPITEISHLFRVASLSKMFTAACVQRLYDQNIVTEGTKVFGKLGITTKALATQTVDPRVNDITVEQLIDHEGGWDSTVAGDWIFRQRKIANDLQLNGPVKKFDVVRYMYGEPLQFTPGAKSQYSNVGYTTLAYLVENLSGQSYQTYLRNNILQPDGITDVHLARTLRAQALAGERSYDDPNVGWSAVEPTQQKRVAYCYGGEGWNTEAMDGSGGLCATASALVQFINLHAVWGRGGRMANAARSGSMAGVSSWAQSRGDGVDFAFVFNTRTLFHMTVDELVDALNARITATPL